MTLDIVSLCFSMRWLPLVMLMFLDVALANTLPPIIYTYDRNGVETTEMVIEDGTVPGYFVAKVAADDPDVSHTTEDCECELEHPNFELKNLGYSKYKLVTKTYIDKSQSAVYFLTVQCKDLTTPSFSSPVQLKITVVSS